MKEPLQKPKISLLNLNFHQFFCSKGLLQQKRYLKGNCKFAFEENRSSCFFETHTSES